MRLVRSITVERQNLSGYEPLFIYYIVPAGGGEGDALVRGNLWTTTVAAAKQYVQGVTAPNVKDRSGLEVVLQDQQGNEIFRCRHKAGPP